MCSGSRGPFAGRPAPYRISALPDPLYALEGKMRTGGTRQGPIASVCRCSEDVQGKDLRLGKFHKERTWRNWESERKREVSLELGGGAGDQVIRVRRGGSWEQPEGWLEESDAGRREPPSPSGTVSSDSPGCHWWLEGREKKSETKLSFRTTFWHRWAEWRQVRYRWKRKWSNRTRVTPSSSENLCSWPTGFWSSTSPSHGEMMKGRARPGHLVQVAESLHLTTKECSPWSQDRLRQPLTSEEGNDTGPEMRKLFFSLCATDQNHNNKKEIRVYLWEVENILKT